MAGRLAVFLILLFFLSAMFLFANGENLTVKIAVMGQGTELYYWWGHISLIIEDSRTNRSYLYDYGLFSFNQEDFFINFAMGRMAYKCGVSPTELGLDVYRAKNRSITIYTLDIPPEARVRVRDFVEWNILPENHTYNYHHFFDNCSTRIRDIIDLATDGQFKEKFGEKMSENNFTLRDHVRRHTWFSPFYDWLLNFWMGQVIDTPLTIWEEMFLPAEVGRRMEDFW